MQRYASSPQTEEPTPVEIPSPDESPVEIPEPEPAEPEQPEQLYAGRFRDPADLERAYLELEQFEGRRSASENELRNQVAELSARLNLVSTATSQTPIQQELSPEQIDRGLERNQAEFLAQLYEADHPSYQDALDRMFDVAPRIASQWQADLAAWETEQRLRGELTPQIAAVRAPVTSNESQKRWNDSWRELAQAHPEMNQLSESMMRDLEQNQHLTLPLKEGLPNAEKLILENLLVRARDANRDKLAEAVAQVDAEIHAEKVDGQVVHASAGAARVGPADALTDEVKRLKQGILAQQDGSNIHAAIAASRGG